MIVNKGLVVLSGGQDSTTTALCARKECKEIHAITFDYNQKHKIEINSAKKIAKLLKFKTHEIIKISNILKCTSPLVNKKKKLEKYNSYNEIPKGIEKTFVPSRNILFLTLASNRAVLRSCKIIYMGVCEEDYGGYPDCRRSFINSMENSLGLGILGKKKYIKIKTPLMKLTKKESVRIAIKNCKNMKEFNKIFKETHTCYDGIKGGCGNCHACILRDKGFNDAGVIDPIWKLRNKKNV